MPTIFAQQLNQLPEWFQYLRDGGALALLAVLVCWIAPRVLKDNREEREARDKSFLDAIRVLQEQFEQRNSRLAGSVAKQTRSLVQEMRDNTQSLTRVLSDVCRLRQPPEGPHDVR